jgi:hypothetical protein
MAEVSVTEYPRLVRQIIEHYAQFRSAVGEIETEVIIDEGKGHFELMRSGWLSGRRVHGSLIHIDVRGGKIWIQHDGTEDGVANELVSAGVPKDRIVLAFKSPELRKHTDFAVT